MATFNQAKDARGKDVVRCFVKGAAPAVMGRVTTALANGDEHPLGRRSQAAGRERTWTRMGEAGLRVMAGAFRDLEAAELRRRTATCSATSRSSR